MQVNDVKITLFAFTENTKPKHTKQISRTRKKMAAQDKVTFPRLIMKNQSSKGNKKWVGVRKNPGPSGFHVRYFLWICTYLCSPALASALSYGKCASQWPHILTCALSHTRLQKKPHETTIYNQKIIQGLQDVLKCSPGISKTVFECS